jgi:pimeloyl-ACP methyl ester carboxylesterase
MFFSRAVDCGGLALHALERPGAGPTVVMLHGWLDHAHSFDWMAEQLPAEWRLFALDFRGHGQSAALPAGSSHQFTDHIADVEALVRQFGLSRLHLVGHSLGGSVATCYAAARAQAVQSLTLIESLGSSGGEPEHAVERLGNFVEELFKPERRRVFPTVEDAARRVAEANSSYSPAAALHMAKFGTTQIEGGVVFSADPRVKRTSGMSFDEGQVLAICRAVKCPVQLIPGSNGMTLGDVVMRARLEALRNPAVTTIEGGHHVHLDRPKEVAQTVRRFIDEANQ